MVVTRSQGDREEERRLAPIPDPQTTDAVRATTTIPQRATTSATGEPSDDMLWQRRLERIVNPDTASPPVHPLGEASTALRPRRDAATGAVRRDVYFPSLTRAREREGGIRNSPPPDTQYFVPLTQAGGEELGLRDPLPLGVEPMTEHPDWTREEDLPIRRAVAYEEPPTQPATMPMDRACARSPAPSRCSNATATRIRLAEQEAEEELLRLEEEQLELKKKRIKARLAKQIEEIEAEDDAAGSIIAPNRKVDEWLQRTAAEAQTTQQPKHEPRTTYRPSAPQPPPEPRKRSPTPARDRSAGGQRGIEKLAEALEKMTRLRPPPRQVYELPTFSGAAGEWLPFKAAYDESTKAYNFTPTENVARLRSCLRGAAREVVAALLHTATEPESIMRTLRQCYGRPEVLVDKALEDLKKLPRLGSSATELNAFAVKLQNIVCVLSTVDNRGYLYNPLLARETLEKMSPHLRSRFCDYASEQMTMEPEICSLSKFLMREADRALRFTFTATGAATTSTPPGRDTTKPVFRPAPRGPAPSATRRAPVYATEAEDRRRCLHCGGDHETPKCRRIIEMDVNQRWEWARDNGVCFRCMDRQHRRENCRARTCEVDGCRHVHHPLLHSNRAAVSPRHSDTNKVRAPFREKAPRSAPNPTSPPTAAPGQAPASESETVSTVRDTDRPKVLLKMCKVQIRGPKGQIDTHALLDDGSTVTLIDEDLAHSIGATGPAVPMQMTGIGSTTELPHSQRVSITIQGQGGAHKITARTVKNLKIHTQKLGREVTKLKHLRGLKDATYDEATPRILIGADNWHLMLVHEARTAKRTQPAAVRTELGWVIYGSVPRAIQASGGTDKVLYVYNMRATNEAERLIEKHFAIDALGVSLAVKQRPADERAQRIFEQTVKFNGDHYEVGLPWKNDEEKTPASYNTALQRLRGVQNKMKKDPKFAEEYATQIRNLLEKGYAKEIQGEEINDRRAWVLPHFAVRNINKPGKLRLVFDAASRSGGKCLNDFLLEGPDLLRSLPGILFRFREGRYAVTADIEEMFLRVKIRAADQPAQMFLWKEPGAEGPPKIFKMSSMIFGASSSPFLAHSVRNYNAERHATEFPEALYPIQNSHYMDDYVDSYATEDEAVRVATAVTEVHRRAGFKLRSWSTNSEELKASIDPELRVNKPTTLGPNDGPKILGLMWDPITDTLGFNTMMNRVPSEVRERTRAPTKREALSAVMSIYDPLGLLSHYTITAKIILQNTWRKQISWDSPLDPEEGEQFDQWARGLAAVAALRLQRNYATAAYYELHIFVDASESAYAVAAYLRATNKDGEVAISLIAGKAKVAPLKQQSIPRMELQAAVIGARLADCIRKEHRINFERITYWTDSRTVLHWVRNDAKRYTPFVAHRLGEIAELTQPAQWRWVPTKENPADDATRADATREVTKDDRWFTGPGFLHQPEDQWPQEDVSDTESTDIEVCTHTRIEMNTSLPRLERFSNYERLLRATARVLQFIDKCRKRGSQLTIEHMRRAEHLWFQQCQTDDFSNEIKILQSGGRLPKSSSLYTLDPVLEDGLLRMRGRINAAPVPSLQKRPVILNGRHEFVKLMIAKAHHDAAHSSNERVVNDLRQHYWILHLRPTVRSVARACRTCVMRHASPRPPAMGDLPLARIEPYCRPFTNVGVDYFGPLVVTIGRRHEKRWVALFTCLTTRAVHLEVAASLTTDSAIMALRRMAARRGWPRLIYSDNGTNFRGADAELRAAYQEWLPELRDYALQHRTEWRFIPPGAPNQGGAWERLVRSIKTALTATLATKTPKEEVLLTLLAEAEQTVNSRPLTHVSVDHRDDEALTPNHFLLGGSAGAPYTGPCDDADRRTWRASQALADHFWARWVREYLPTLAPRQSPSGGERPLRVGDLVIIVDANLPRNVWPRGIIEAIYPGPDGGVRSADVRTKGGVFRRPTTRLAVLPIATEASPTDTAGGGCYGQPASAN